MIDTQQFGTDAYIMVSVSDDNDPESPLEAELWDGTDWHALGWTTESTERADYLWLIRSAANRWGLHVEVEEGIEDADAVSEL